MEHLPSRIPADVLDEPVNGGSLHVSGDGFPTLRSQLDPERPTLLVFLRHLGCIFCREMVKDVRIAADRADSLAGGTGDKRYPRVVFVHTAAPEAAARFFGRFWPGAPALSDPRKRLYGAMGLRRGTPIQLLSPRVWAGALRAAFKGHAIGRPAGDPWMMPGVVLIAPDGRILHRHTFANIGDHPQFEQYAHFGNPPAAPVEEQPPHALPRPA